MMSRIMSWSKVLDAYLASLNKDGGGAVAIVRFTHDRGYQVVTWTEITHLWKDVRAGKVRIVMQATVPELQKLLALANLDLFRTDPRNGNT